MNSKFNKLFLITALFNRKFKFRPIPVFLFIFFGMQLFLLSACKKKSDFASDSKDGNAFYYDGSDKFIASAVKKLNEQNSAHAFPIADNDR